jgi:hypothetical protein
VNGEGRDPARDVGLVSTVRDLRRRILALSRVLPVPYLRYLDADLDEIEVGVHQAALLRGLTDSVEFVNSGVESALREVWSRAEIE